jgi:hypothetical protein
MQRLVLLLVAAALPGAKGAPPRFLQHVVDGAPPRDPWQKLAGDVDGDGQIDVLVGSRKGPLVAYLAPGWREVRITPGGYDSVDGEVGDLDGDGDLDVVLGGTIWLENPSKRGAPLGADWRSHRLDEARAHDVEVADVDGDGDLDVVTRSQSSYGVQAGNQIRIFRNDGRGAAWTKRLVECPHGEGLATADLDADKDLDLVMGGRWYETPSDLGAGAWKEHVFAERWTVPDAKVAVGDLDGDGRPDVVLAPAEHIGHESRMAWYQAPRDPKEARGRAFTEHVLADMVENVVHGLAVGDLDGDGQGDVVASEMHQGRDPDEVFVLYNRGGGRAWQRAVLSRQGSHNLRLFDLGKDGDLDVLGANQGGPHQSVEIWENLRKAPSPLPINRWRRHVVDAERPGRAVFLLAEDLDGDGRRDLATGGFWYRNPGVPGAWPRTPIGEPLNGVAVAWDIDADGDVDLLGTQGRGGESNATFAWARNDGKGGFAILKNLPGGEGDFLQGAAVWGGGPRGAATVALSWHKPGCGVQLLTAPEDPTGPSWLWTRLGPESQDEGLSAGDLDGDGDIDLLLGTRWLRRQEARGDGKGAPRVDPRADPRPGSGPGGTAAGGGKSERASDWRLETLTATQDPPDRNVIADLDGDGRLDVVMTYEAINKPGKVAWYAAPAAASGPWREVVISDDVLGPMSLSVADVNRDGRPDVIVGEHNVREPQSARLFVFVQEDDRGQTWRREVVHTGDEHHGGAVAVDFDADGDVDIASIGWTHGRVSLYENLARRP